MSYRIAFASSDGKVVNQHFGRAKKFIIFEIEGSSAEFVELRDNKPACEGFEHSEKALNRSVETLSDCRAVFVTQIGYGALAALQAKGIRAYEAPGLINEVLGKIIASELKI
ncbi:MAG: NifB/NifX family molybdenum-iron cluster-binding protein [Bacillota bacterium]|nr:NifB/NifX family molybdenum-iron cluster-binding protein [Bacillota bacterium]